MIHFIGTPDLTIHATISRRLPISTKQGKIRLVYWSQGEPLVNFGDYVTQYFLERLGLPFEFFDDSQPEDGTPIFFGVGTMFADYWFADRARSRPVIVWGSGYGGADLSLPVRADVRAVRGPLTRDHLGLPKDIPLGDPALLLPHFLPMPATGTGPSVYLPHWENLRESAGIVGFAAELGAESILSPLVDPTRFPALIRELATASFVFTSSLHGAIVAQAYGVPWSPCLMPNEAFNLAPKWDDFLLYLGINPQSLPRTYATSAHAEGHCHESRQWWSRHVAGRPKPALDSLVRAFPFPGL